MNDYPAYVGLATSYPIQLPLSRIEDRRTTAEYYVRGTLFYVAKREDILVWGSLNPHGEIDQGWGIPPLAPSWIRSCLS